MTWLVLRSFSRALRRLAAACFPRLAQLTVSRVWCQLRVFVLSSDSLNEPLLPSQTRPLARRVSSALAAGVLQFSLNVQFCLSSASLALDFDLAWLSVQQSVDKNDNRILQNASCRAGVYTLDKKFPVFTSQLFLLLKVFYASDDTVR